MKIITILIIALLSYNNSSSQNTLQGRVTYEVSYIGSIDATAAFLKKRKTPEKDIKLILATVRNYKNVIATLEFANNETKYTVEKEEMSKTAITKYNKPWFVAGGNDIYYRNFSLKEYYSQQFSFDETLLVEAVVPKWQVTQKTKKIGKYVCYKAIDLTSKNTKQKAFVWFTPEITLNSGPRHYFGLPGLILEVKEYNYLFKAIKIELNPKKKIVIQKPTKGKKITQKELSEKIDKFWSNKRKKS